MEPSPSRLPNDDCQHGVGVMMDLHFLGRGAADREVGILDLRMLGIAKQIPIASLAR